MGGKKGSWISAIKRRLFRSNSTQLNEANNHHKPRGRFKHGSFFPFCREPSSIEQILGEIDQHHLLNHPTAQPQPQPQQPQPQSQSQPQPQPQPQPHSQPQPPQPHSQPQPQPQPQSQPQQQPQSQPQPRSKQQSQAQAQAQPRSKPQSQPQPQPQPQAQAQPSSSSSSGRPVSPPPPLQRLRVVHQQHPKTSNKPEPTLQQRHFSATRIQTAYRSYIARRNTRGLTGLARLQQVVASKSVKRQTVNAMKQMQLLVRVQTQIQSRRMQMLENLALKSQANKNNPHKQSDEHWDDSVITKEEREARLQRKADAAIKRERAMAYAYSRQLWKDAPTSSAHNKMGGYPWWWKWLEHQMPYHHATPTLKNQSFESSPSRSSSSHKQLDMPTTPMSSRSTNRFIKARKGACYPMKDDDSLRSCPPFSVPNYMSPTAAARAKARPTSNPRERCVTPTTPASESSRRRFSLPSTPRTNKSPGSIGDLSMDSSLGRKPFNRFV